MVYKLKDLLNLYNVSFSGLTMAFKTAFSVFLVQKQGISNETK